MSAVDLHVERLHAQYAVPGDGDAERRLKSLLGLVLDGELESALVRAGVPDGDELLCIREVHARARLALASGPDGALAASWSDAIAAALVGAIRAAGPGVVRYASRRHALTDAAVCVACGTAERAWAWRQAGVWPASGEAPERVLLAALLADPPAIAPVLAHVAVATERLPALAAAFGERGLRALAGAALISAGMPPERAEEVAAAPGRPEVGASPALERALARSRIALALAPVAAAPVAVAALALAETEPSALAAGAADLGAVLEAVPEAPAWPVVAVPASDPEAAERPIPARPARLSDWGGLVFALHALDALDAGRRLADLPLRPAMAALGRRLVPCEADDPALLAFAGLAPDARAPDPLVGDEEQSAVDVLATQVVAEIAARLEVEPADLDLHALFARRAEVAGDPGWIDVRLDLEQVDLNVRRCGLDIDPGHLAWLGCVVRIVYA